MFANRCFKPVILVLLALLVASSLGIHGAQAFISPTTTPTGDPLPAPGNVIVVLKSGLPIQGSDQATYLKTSLGLHSTAEFSTLFNGFSANLNARQLRMLAGNPLVANLVTDTPVFAMGQTTGTQIERIGLASYTSASATDVDIAIVDTGVAHHSDLRVAGGVACLGGSAFSDVTGHATHVAGVAAAKNNSIGIVGSAPGARI